MKINLIFQQLLQDFHFLPHTSKRIIVFEFPHLLQYMITIITVIVQYDNVLGKDKWSEGNIIQSFDFEGS